MFLPSARLLEASSPRYTSYPPATHFGADVDADMVAAWLGALDAETELSLYLHVPFCRSICWYCGCHAVATRRDEPVVAYADMLAAEIALVSETASARRVTQIHWGGGTPSILTPETLLRLTAALEDRFDLTPATEHAIEVDPRTLSPRHAEAFAIAGVNRVSFGVQDLNPKVQAAIGRVQPFETLAAAVAMVRAVGIEAISFDVMFGLPGQTEADARRTATLATSLSPGRIAAFGYAHVPWFKSRQRLIEEPDLPGPRDRLAQAAAIGETLRGHGYVEVGFDHYARSNDALAQAAAAGHLRRNFQGYVTHQPAALVGLGASAISSLPQGYAQNAPDLGGWRSAVAEGRFATVRGARLSQEDKRRRAIIESLLCAFTVNLAPHGGFAAFTDAVEPLAELAAEGIVAVNGDEVVIRPAAKPFARLVAQAFDTYRDRAAARHSRTV